MRKFTIAFLFLYIVHSTLYITPAFAQGGSLSQFQNNPASPLYFLKGVREAFEIKFAATPRVKALRELEFSMRRIKEVKSLSLSSRQDLIEPTLARYLTNLKDLKNKGIFYDEAVVTQTTASVIEQMQMLLAAYYQVTEPGAKMSLRATINRLTQWDQEFIDKLHALSKPHLAEKVAPSKLSGCKFLSKEASSAALLEVEREVFGERAKVCFETLEKLES